MSTNLRLRNYHIDILFYWETPFLRKLRLLHFVTDTCPHVAVCRVDTTFLITNATRCFWNHRIVNERKPAASRVFFFFVVSVSIPEKEDFQSPQCQPIRYLRTSKNWSWHQFQIILPKTSIPWNCRHFSMFEKKPRCFFRVLGTVTARRLPWSLCAAEGIKRSSEKIMGKLSASVANYSDDDARRTILRYGNTRTPQWKDTAKCPPAVGSSANFVMVSDNIRRSFS